MWIIPELDHKIRAKFATPEQRSHLLASSRTNVEGNIERIERSMRDGYLRSSPATRLVAFFAIFVAPLVVLLDAAFTSIRRYAALRYVAS
jgi:hypothetical protein